MVSSNYFDTIRNKCIFYYDVVNASLDSCPLKKDALQTHKLRHICHYNCKHHGGIAAAGEMEATSRAFTNIFKNNNNNIFFLPAFQDIHFVCMIIIIIVCLN